MKKTQPKSTRQANALPPTDHLGTQIVRPPAEAPRFERPASLPTVIVYVEGGIVQRCLSDWPVRVIVADADHDGAEPERTTALPDCGCVRVIDHGKTEANPAEVSAALDFLTSSLDNAANNLPAG